MLRPCNLCALCQHRLNAHGQMAHEHVFNHLNKFEKNDLATWNRDMALLSGVRYSGFFEATAH